MGKYASKVDWWLKLILVGGIGISLTSSVALIVSALLMSGFPNVLWAALISLPIGVVLPLWIWRGTYYAFDGSLLRIRSGPFRWNVPIANITTVSKTRNPLSSPALSLDRLRIEYGDKSVMISPHRTEEFLKELEERRQGAAAGR